MRPVPACYTSGRDASNFLGPGRCTIGDLSVRTLHVRLWPWRFICMNIACEALTLEVYLYEHCMWGSYLGGLSVWTLHVRLLPWRFASESSPTGKLLSVLWVFLMCRVSSDTKAGSWLQIPCHNVTKWHFQTGCLGGHLDMSLSGGMSRYVLSGIVTVWGTHQESSLCLDVSLCLGYI